MLTNVVATFLIWRKEHLQSHPRVSNDTDNHSYLMLIKYPISTPPQNTTTPLRDICNYFSMWKSFFMFPAWYMKIPSSYKSQSNLFFFRWALLLLGMDSNWLNNRHTICFSGIHFYFVSTILLYMNNNILPCIHFKNNFEVKAK